MDWTIEQLSDFDIFFYYGSGDLEVETKSDIFQNLMQPKRSLFYDRDQDSSGVKEYENRPLSLFLQINLPYDIVESLSKRNSLVSNGEDNLPDRRIAISQDLIDVEIDNGLKINLSYIPLANFKQTDQINVLLPSSL